MIVFDQRWSRVTKWPPNAGLRKEEKASQEALKVLELEYSMWQREGPETN